MQNPHVRSGAALRREIARALALLFAGTALIAVVSLAFPALRGYQQGLLAVLLFTVPSFVLRGSGATIDDLGVDLGPAPRTARLAILTSLIVFPLFIAGFHLLQTRVLDREAAFSVDALMRWGEGLDEPPADPCADPDGATVAWFGGGGLWVVGPPDGTLAVRVRSPASVGAARAVSCRTTGASPEAPVTTRVVRADAGGWLDAGADRGLWLPLGDAREVDVEVTLDGRPVPDDRLRLGAHGASAAADGRLVESRSLWWILGFLVIHLGLVALPEEWFFRGYLQARLDTWLGTPWRLWGAQVGWGFILSAAAFALLHPILIPGPHRLLVFFPGLLFGWLRARGGNIGAAVVVHALSNLVQALVSPMYH